MSLPIPVLPNLGEFKIESTVTDLGQITLPSTVNSGSESRSATHYANRPDGLDGSIFERAPAFEPIGMTLSGPLMDYTTVRKLKRIIGLGRVKITRSFNNSEVATFSSTPSTYGSEVVTFSSLNNYTLNADVVDWSLKEMVLGSVWNFDMGVQSNQYYWSGDLITSSTNPSVVTNTGHFSVYPTLKFTGTGSGATVLTVDINGAIATFTGTVASGEVLIIDCENLTVVLDGANSLDSMNAEFYSAPPILYPGDNDVTITLTGTADLVVEFTEKHL